jgi:hypothetical protein
LKNYAAVSAKATLEAISRNIALEFGNLWYYDQIAFRLALQCFEYDSR